MLRRAVLSCVEGKDTLSHILLRTVSRSKFFGSFHPKTALMNGPRISSKVSSTLLDDVFDENGKRRYRHLSFKVVCLNDFPEKKVLLNLSLSIRYILLHLPEFIAAKNGVFQLVLLYLIVAVMKYGYVVLAAIYQPFNKGNKTRKVVVVLRRGAIAARDLFQHFV